MCHFPSNFMKIKFLHNPVDKEQTNRYWWNEKKRSEETQTLRAGCNKAEPIIFAPSQTPFPGAWDGHNLISWRWSLSLPTNPVWWGSMHAISSYRVNRPTHTYKPTDRPITIHCAATSAQCKHYLLDGGNYWLIDWLQLFNQPPLPQITPG